MGVPDGSLAHSRFVQRMSGISLSQLFFCFGFMCVISFYYYLQHVVFIGLLGLYVFPSSLSVKLLFSGLTVCFAVACSDVISVFVCDFHVFKLHLYLLLYILVTSGAWFSCFFRENV